MDTFKFIDFDQASAKINEEDPIVVDIRDKDSFDNCLLYTSDAADE